jgi:hypothetical protein
MTKPRPRRGRDEIEIDDVSWRYLCDATTPEDEADHGWLLFGLEFNELELAIVQPPTGKRTSDLWAQYGAEIITWWCKENPGTRPRTWWKFQAPEPRRRVGGIGTTKREVLGHPEYIKANGLPCPEGFVLPEDLAWWPWCERAAATAVDYDNPPKYEAQAAYLSRLEMLQPGEANRLTARDFEPQAFTKEELRADLERRRRWNERAGIPQQL